MSDSDESESDVPPREVCEQRCQSFASVTGTDSALAMFYLQDRGWDLQVSLNAFFEQNPNTPSKNNKPSQSVGDNTSQPHMASQSGSAPSSTPSVPVSESQQPTPQIDPEPHRIRIMTWNVDGLDDCNLVTRTNAVCKVIQQEKPDVVYLQELVPRTQELLEEGCPLYQLIPSIDESYYSAILLRAQTTTYTSHHITPFYTSKMGRNLLEVQARVKGVELLLMTSHLESTKAHAEERKRQLQRGLKVLCEAPPQQTVVFGGDFNLRDNELVEVGGLPDRVYDLWEVTGKRKEAKFTWDLQRNDNKQMPSRYQPRCRFDRLYLRHPTQGTHKLKPVYFELVGIQRIPECQRFPSDHWGLLAHFDKV